MTHVRVARRLEGLGVTLLRRFLAEAPSDAISLGLGMANEDVPPTIRHALANADSAKRADYGPNAGNPELRARIAASYSVESDRIIVTAGVQEGIALAMFGLVDPGDDVLVPAPAFPVYGTLAELAGGTVRTYALRPEDRFRPTWSAIRDALRPETRIVVVCSPGNPTGAAATDAEWRAIAQGCKDAGVLVLSDEIYTRLQLAGGHPSMAALDVDAVVLDGLSKSHALAGWRVGWMLAPAAIAEPLVALHQHLVTSASTLVQEAALAAFDTDTAAFPANLIASLSTRRKRSIDRLTAAGWTHAAGDAGLFIWVQLPGHDDELALARRLLHETRVVTIPGRAFGDAGRGYLRLSVSAAEDDLERALDRLTAWTAEQCR